jgi:hypothetical protein
MIDEKVLKELASVQTQGPMLSVYLDVDPVTKTSEAYKLELREMLKSVENSAHKEDIESVRRYIEYAYDGSGRGLVVFSHQADDIWYAFPLAVPVDPDIKVSHKPFLSPLIELIGQYGRYAVGILDRQGGRFLLFKMGELVTTEEVTGEEVRHRRKGRGSSVFGMRGGAGFSGRKETELVQRNLKEAAGRLSEFCEKHSPKQLLLAGSDRTLAQLQDFLPSKLKGLVSGTFSSDMDATENQIRDLSFKLIQELAVQRHKDLVKTIRTSAAKGGNGVVGLDSTLSIAHEGRIQALITARDYHAPGFRCSGCGYLTTQPLEKCLFCGEEFEEIPDAVEAVIAQVVNKGGSADVIDEELMDRIRIGALLRY